ncbi:hypothetical protein ABR738_30700 [Streptomyces sp. Edi4]|uniref:hypothetical protein n=1 Tax=Streptomyces sp. Edi4 TaxID=3162527 RepID=UPI0033066F2E
MCLFPYDDDPERDDPEPGERAPAGLLFAPVRLPGGTEAVTGPSRTALGTRAAVGPTGTARTAPDPGDDQALARLPAYLSPAYPRKQPCPPLGSGPVTVGPALSASWAAPAPGAPATVRPAFRVVV